MQIIDGKKTSELIALELQDEIISLKKQGVTPTLVVVHVGDDPASAIYVKNKVLFSEKLGAKTIVLNLAEKTTNEELIENIQKLNSDRSVHGILVQLPLPKHLDENLIIENISPQKDVDCFHLNNVGKLWTAKQNTVNIKPCTPAGVIELLKRNQVNLVGKNVVVMGRSNIVGKPQAALFLLEDSTVTLVHSNTKNIEKVCASADIFVVAIGKPKYITKQYTNPNQIIVDIGINRDCNGKLCGDVDFEDVKDHCKMITPVPGGVGPMTITMLMKNLIFVAREQNKK